MRKRLNRRLFAIAQVLTAMLCMAVTLHAAKPQAAGERPITSVLDQPTDLDLSGLTA